MQSDSYLSFRSPWLPLSWWAGSPQIMSQKKPLPPSITRKRLTSTRWVAYPVEISYILVLSGKPRSRCFSWRLAHGLVDHLTIVSSNGVICFAQKPTSSGNPRRHTLCKTISLGIPGPCWVKITTPTFNIGFPMGREQVSPEQNPLWKEALEDEHTGTYSSNGNMLSSHRNNYHEKEWCQRITPKTLQKEWHTRWVKEMLKRCEAVQTETIGHNGYKDQVNVGKKKKKWVSRNENMLLQSQCVDKTVFCTREKQ